MTSTFTMYARQELLDAVFRPDVFTAPTTLQVALTAGIPPANASVDQLVEPTAPEYARQTYSLGSSHWAPTGFGELYNTTKVTFPQAVISWGLILGWALIDEGANAPLAVGSLANPFVADPGVVPFLDPGSMTFGLYD